MPITIYSDKYLLKLIKPSKITLDIQIVNNLVVNIRGYIYLDNIDNI